MNRTLPLLTLTAMLTACGGGSGGSSSTPVDPPTTPPSSPTLSVVEEQGQGSLSAALVYDGYLARELDYQWQQTSGQSVNITNPTSPLLAFDAPQAGSYGFSYRISNRSGELTSGNLTLNADRAGDDVRIRGDQVTPEGGRVSLRLGRSGNHTTAASNIQWRQVSGPTISDLNFENPELATFTAPNVTKDAVVIIEVTATSGGNSYQDQALVMITDELPPVNDALFDEPITRVEAWNANSPWKSALERCVYSTQFTQNSVCGVNELPLIGQETSNPSLDEVMDRVVVSHPWMGDAFKAFLQEKDQSGDFKQLLAGVTAVVISYDIRPSFYWVVSGAIYLDPSDLWQQPWQMATINEDPDYRSGFGSELQFLIPWRYTKNNNYASLYFAPEFELQRTLTQLEPDFASLLYHELAHANDFFPKSIHNDITEPSLLQEFFKRSNNSELISDRLTAQSPLTSAEMHALGDVLFRGESASAAQKAYQPDDIANFFGNDRASDDYAYSTSREDLAMLFEEAMMRHRYGIERDIAVTNLPEQITGDSILVEWGQRGRIGESRVKARLPLVLEEILPSANGDSIINGLPAPTPMISGLSWNTNLVLGSSAVRLAQPNQALGSQYVGKEGAARHSDRGPTWQLKP